MDTIYRSSHHDVLAAWENHKIEYEQWLANWREQVVAWGLDVDKNKPYVANSAWGPAHLVGVYWGYDRDELPLGWKRVDRGSKSHIIEPYRSKPKGDPQIQAEFAALVKIPDIRRDFEKLGMPHHVFKGLSVSTYGVAPSTFIEFASPVVWIRWHDCAPENVDETYWEHVKTSEFYAMVENGFDPFAKTEDESEG